MLLRPVARSIAGWRRRGTVFFPPGNAAAQTELAADTIEVPDADRDAKLLLESRLHFSAWCLWSGLQERFKSCGHRFTQFGKMPMSPLLKSSLAMSTPGVEPAIRRGATDV